MSSLFLILVLQSVSFASPDWLVCEKSSECVVGEEVCYGPLALNKKFLEKNREQNKRDRLLSQCIEYMGPVKESYIAICEKKKCHLKQKYESLYPKQEIVQAILDLPELQKYWHPKLPGRVPVVLSDREIERGFVLKKFGQPVRIVPDKEVKGAFLRFTHFQCKFGNYCNVVFEYPAEGIVGSTGVLISPERALRFEKTDIAESKR